MADILVLYKHPYRPWGWKNKSNGRSCVKILSKHMQVRARERAFMREHATEHARLRVLKKRARLLRLEDLFADTYD